MICVNFPSAILGAKRKAVLFNNKPQIDHIGWGFIFGIYKEVIYCQKPLSIANSTEIKHFTYVFLHTKFYAASKKKNCLLLLLLQSVSENSQYRTRIAQFL